MPRSAHASSVTDEGFTAITQRACCADRRLYGAAVRQAARPVVGGVRPGVGQTVALPAQCSNDLVRFPAVG